MWRLFFLGISWERERGREREEVPVVCAFDRAIFQVASRKERAGGERGGKKKEGPFSPRKKVRSSFARIDRARLVLGPVSNFVLYCKLSLHEQDL